MYIIYRTELGINQKQENLEEILEREFDNGKEIKWYGFYNDNHGATEMAIKTVMSKMTELAKNEKCANAFSKVEVDFMREPLNILFGAQNHTFLDEDDRNAFWQAISQARKNGEIEFDVDKWYEQLLKDKESNGKH